MEQWRDIVGYEGMYQVSDTGRVKTLRRLLHIPYTKREHYSEEKILKLCDHPRGYFVVYLSKDNFDTKFFVHRLVAAAFHDNFEDHAIVNHTDGNKRNNRADNLEWTNSGDNTRHHWNGVRIMEDKEMAF